jgi:hypothetical protein
MVPPSVEPPQSSQGTIAPCGPLVLGSRFPQASQKSIDHIATMISDEPRKTQAMLMSSRDIKRMMNSRQLFGVKGM